MVDIWFTSPSSEGVGPPRQESGDGHSGLSFGSFARLAIAFILAGAAGLACAQGEGDQAPTVAEPPVRATSNYNLTHEGLGISKITSLREQEELDQVLVEARTEQDLFESLTVWARRQFEPGIPEPYPLSNGLDILTDIRAGKTGGFCGQYAYLLADALKSFGYFDVRYVETWADEKRSHFLVEVWSNQHASWMLLDPLYATTVVNEAGAPQSTWDAHAVAAGSGRDVVRRKWLAPAAEVSREPDAEYFELFRLPAVSLRSNLAREMSPWSIAGRQAQFLALRDDSNADLLPGFYLQESNRKDDFRAARNLCRIEVEAAEEGHIVRLDNLGTCAHFWKFLIRLDGGDWRDTKSETHLLEPFRVLECCTVNRMGVRGVVTRLALPDREY